MTSHVNLLLLLDLQMTDIDRNQLDTLASGKFASTIFRLSKPKCPKRRSDEPLRRNNILPRTCARARDIARESAHPRHQLHPPNDRFRSIRLDETPQKLVRATNRH